MPHNPNLLQVPQTDEVVVDGQEFYEHPSAETLAEVEKWKAASVGPDVFICTLTDKEGNKLLAVVQTDKFIRGVGSVVIPVDENDYKNIPNFSETLIQLKGENIQFFAGVGNGLEDYRKLGLEFDEKRGDWCCSSVGSEGLWIYRKIFKDSFWREQVDSSDTNQFFLCAEGLRLSFEQAFLGFKIEPMAVASLHK